VLDTERLYVSLKKDQAMRPQGTMGFVGSPASYAWGWQTSSPLPVTLAPATWASLWLRTYLQHHHHPTMEKRYTHKLHLPDGGSTALRWRGLSESPRLHKSPFTALKGPESTPHTTYRL